MQLIASSVPRSVLATAADNTQETITHKVGQSPFGGNSFFLNTPEAAPWIGRWQAFCYHPVKNSVIHGSIDIQVDTKREEVIVIDTNKTTADHVAILGVGFCG